jgi:ABC-2 type transport system ATP-binding protein
VSVVGVSRLFGRTAALQDVSFDVPYASVCALLGPNGAGKSTLMRLLTGLVAPTGGSIWVDGVDVCANPSDVRRRIGWFPSGDRTFYLRLTGLENLIFFGRLHGLTRRAAAARATEVLEQVELGGAARRRVGTYSHGMQKRLSMARALLIRPRLLLVDEATHDLDPAGAQRVKELVREAAHGGAAVLWATQRLDEIRGFADQVVLLDRGHVRFRGPVDELIAEAVTRRYIVRTSPANGTPPRTAVERLRAELNGVATVEPLAGSGNLRIELAADRTLSSVLTALAHAGLRVEDCTHELSAIETAFLQMTGDPE